MTFSQDMPNVARPLERHEKINQEGKQQNKAEAFG